MKKLALALAGLLAPTTCGPRAMPNTNQSATQPTASFAAPGDTDQTSVTLTIFAATSLEDVFPKIHKGFRKTHPNYTIEFSFGGSSELATQVNGGAEADIFASANEKQMKMASNAGNADTVNTKIFATNTLMLVTLPSSPTRITKLEGATKGGMKLVVCVEQIPCGATIKKLAETTGFTFTPVSKEWKVTDVLAKVTSGEIDAGPVHAIDAAGTRGKVKIVDIPEAEKIVDKYSIAVMKSTRQDAQAFVNSVLGEQGQTILWDTGFDTPK